MRRNKIMNNIKLIAFDVDGTLTKGYGWKLFHDVGGVTPKEHKDWRDTYMAGMIDYVEWHGRMEVRYKEKGMTKKIFTNAVQNIEFYNGARECIAQIQKRYLTCLASSSPNLYVEAVAKRLGVKRFHAAIEFVFDKKGVFQKIQFDTVDTHQKVNYLKSLCQELKITSDQIVYVGDSDNDLEAFRFTGRGILVGNGNDTLRNTAWKQIHALHELPQLLL